MIKKEKKQIDKHQNIYSSELIIKIAIDRIKALK
jgi:hypothetical protein